MKSEKNYPAGRRKKTTKQKSALSGRGMVLLLGTAAIALLLSVGIHRFQGASAGRVYASDTEGDAAYRELRGSLKGIVKSGASDGITVERIGTSCEDVIVGQRVNKVVRSVTPLDVGKSMEHAVLNLENHSAEAALNPKLMSDMEYENLLSLVEAEAAGEDLKGKILIANVVMNRVKDPLFPDTVSEVIWDTSGGVAQFSPVGNGRISTVVPSEETKEAVRQALNGVDYSKGALFFMARALSDEEGVDWFSSDLQPLFTHGGHEFYTYPDSIYQQAGVEVKKSVDLVKNDASDSVEELAQ